MIRRSKTVQLNLTTSFGLSDSSLYHLPAVPSVTGRLPQTTDRGCTSESPLPSHGNHFRFSFYTSLSYHGENHGELAVYGDRQTADHITNRVPFIIRHPQGLGGRARVDTALHYQFDIAATALEMTGAAVPETWDVRSFRDAFRHGEEEGRSSLVISNCAWSCQRSVRSADYLLIRTYHSGLKNYPPLMLFNIKDDPRELCDLADREAGLTAKSLTMLDEWHAAEMARSGRTPQTPCG